MIGGGRDLLVCAALVVATSIYVASWPHNFDGFDEGMYLYEAKRILDGDVMYRDFFQILTPAWFYLMAGCYALFGVSLETARATMVVVHAAIVGMMFMISRRVGLPWTVAALLAVLHLTLGYPASSIATPHWFSTVLSLIIAAVVLRSPCATPLRAAGWGVLIGVLILVQQQKGTIMALGVGLIMAMDARERTPMLRAISARMTAYLSGIAATVTPVMLTFVAVAGFDNVWNALVYYPLHNYPRIHQHVPWGFYVPGVVPMGLIIQCLPGIIPIAAGVGFWRVVSGAGANDRRFIVLLTLSLFALLSVLYNPNYFHFALAAPLWFVLGGAVLIPYWNRDGRARTGTKVAVHAVALVLLLLCVGQLSLSLRSRRDALPAASLTAFGWVDTWNDDQPKLIQQLSELLHDQQGTDIFVYPANPGLYLITGLRNPTRYQIVLPSYTDRRELDEIIDNLEQRRVEFVVSHMYPGPGQLEPLSSYIRDRYELVANIGGNVVYRRKGSQLLRSMF